MDDIEGRALIARQIRDEILAEEKSWRETIRVGDWVDSAEDATYTPSNIQYRTKDRLYEIVDVRYVRDAGASAIVSGDYLEESTSIHKSRVIVRDGKVIWRSRIQQHLVEMRQAGEQIKYGLDDYLLDEERAMREAGLCK